MTTVLTLCQFKPHSISSRQFNSSKLIQCHGNSDVLISGKVTTVENLYKLKIKKK